MNNNNKINVLSSGISDKWTALENEFPIPYMEVLFFSAKDYSYRVGYWDPIEEKIAMSTTIMDRSSEEAMLLSERISETNPKFSTATHWRFLPSQPTKENDTDKNPSECKSIKDILNSDDDLPKGAGQCM